MSTGLRAAIVDDEPLARLRLARILDEVDGVSIVGTYGNGHAALEGLHVASVDVVFLDIRMPEIDGFQLLERMPGAARPLVVFVSAYGERALEAFDVQAVDYLVKPLSPSRVHDAVARVRARLEHLRSRVATDLGDAAGGVRYPQRLAVPDGTRLRMVPVEEIMMLVAQGNYVELVLSGRSLLLRETLSSLVERLDPARFVRIHRSRAVRIDLIEQVEPCGAGQYWMRLKDGSCLTSGRSFRKPLRDALGIVG